ncbi:MAG TPA: hypothetical protein VL307_10345 [Chitinophagaceae bacterium]|nr:hypothetical protein [Chitinophagaceae bacterium]
MTRECQQFKTSRRTLEDINPCYLNSFLSRLVPDEQFRFITFETTDYRNHNVTYLLFNYIPETVMLTVESAAEIEPAIETLAALNPDVQWSGVQLKYLDKDNEGHAYITIELQLTSVPMRVSAEGVLLAL